MMLFTHHVCNLPTRLRAVLTMYTKPVLSFLSEVILSRIYHRSIKYVDPPASILISSRKSSYRYSPLIWRVSSTIHDWTLGNGNGAPPRITSTKSSVPQPRR